jgi:putative ABC transport system substrate-binding protein
MRRRSFFAGLAGTAAWAATGRGWSQQPARVHRLAFVVTTTPLAQINETDHMPYRALMQELRRRGYVEDRNLITHAHSGEGKPDRFPQLAQEVVALDPDAIVATTEELALPLKQATDRIPIVVSSTDPVFKGLVSSLARPGGNVTGVAIDAGLEGVEKLFEVMKDIQPRVSRVGFLTGMVAAGSRSPAWHAAVRERVLDRFAIVLLPHVSEARSLRSYCLRLMYEARALSRKKSAR